MSFHTSRPPRPPPGGGGPRHVFAVDAHVWGIARPWSDGTVDARNPASVAVRRQRKPTMIRFLARHDLGWATVPLGGCAVLAVPVLGYKFAPGYNTAVAIVSLMATLAAVCWFSWQAMAEELRLAAERRDVRDARLSEKYGVEIRHSAEQGLWRIAGELRKATYARAEDALLVGGRELARAAA